MNAVTVGLLAGIFTTFASLPQIIRVLRTRSMNDVSLITLCMFAVGVVLWLSYGLMIGAAPVIIWNVLSLGFYLIQIVLKLALSARGARVLDHLRGGRRAFR